MSSVRIPGLDIEERSPGSFRIRTRVHPFYAVNKTFSSELAAVSWGCVQLERLRELHRRLLAAGTLPSSAITRAEAVDLGLATMIDEPGVESQHGPLRGSPGDAISVHDVLDSYLANEAKTHVTEYGSRARHLKTFFGNVPMSAVTTEALQSYIRARLSGELGSGRSQVAGYATKNREYQQNLRRRRRGIPIVRRETPKVLPSNESVRHELKLFRRALKAYIARDDALREQIAGYVGTHPVVTVQLPPPGEPRKRRISDDELSVILKKMSCPRKRAAIMLAIYTSIRRAEVVSLQWEDVHWNQSTVRLRAPLEADPLRPGQLRKKVKTKTVERDLPLIPEALELLRSLGLALKGPIFDFKAASLTQAFGRAAEDSAVLDIRVHDARRESLSWLHDVYGLTLEQLTMFSGHTETKTLQRHYFQPSASRLAATLAKARVERRVI